MPHYYQPDSTEDYHDWRAYQVELDRQEEELVEAERQADASSANDYDAPCPCCGSSDECYRRSYGLIDSGPLYENQQEASEAWEILDSITAEWQDRQGNY